MMTDLSVVPLVALSCGSRQIISSLLNPPKIIPCEAGLPRDWRGLAHLSDLSGEIMPLLTSHSDPSAHILSVLEQKSKNITIKDLQTILEKIDRWDIIDDTETLFENDAQTYLEELKRSQTSAELIENSIDEQVLTVDDLHRVRQGLENQYYDAFLLYADEDVSFAQEMMENLEKKYDLKLCIKDRDLIGGITFEHEAVMTLISERCNRLIVIISPNFLRSPANKFFLNYAQALGIDKRQRKIVPCLYEKCQLPPQLSYMFILDYNRVGLYDFWGKLRDSVEAPSTKQITGRSTLPPPRQKELFQEKRRCNSECTEENWSIKEKNSKLLNEKMTISALTVNTENSMSSIDDVGNTNSRTMLSKSAENLKSVKKSMKIFQWTKWRSNKTAESPKQNYEPMLESITIDSLPSTNTLDTITVDKTVVDKPRKKKFIQKYVRKVKSKKILLNS